jgi:putative sigma-54 modulation protein
MFNSSKRWQKNNKSLKGGTVMQKIEIVGHELQVSDRLKDYINQKLVKVDRHLPNLEETRVDLEHVKSARSASDRYIAQITLRGKGFILRSEERSDDIRNAMDEALDKILRRIERFKGKRQHGRGDGKSAAEVVPESSQPEEEEQGGLITRRKAFELVPMAEEDALEQMRLLGHDNFFIFINIKSGNINVVYRRRDGTYGLIEPLVR